MNIPHAPSSGCYRFGPDPDDFVCFCDLDFCNSQDKIEQLFLNIHVAERHQSQNRQTATTSQPSNQQSSQVTTISFNEELRKFRSPLLTDRQHEWRRQIRQKRQSFEQKVSSQKFVLANERTVFRKKTAKME